MVVGAVQLVRGLSRFERNRDWREPRRRRAPERSRRRRSGRRALRRSIFSIRSRAASGG